MTLTYEKPFDRPATYHDAFFGYDVFEVITIENLTQRETLNMIQHLRDQGLTKFWVKR